MKFRKKPVVIDAEQWFKDGDNKHVERVCGASADCEVCKDPKTLHGWISTLEGGHIVCPGDWIITGVKGEKYPCKPDIFQATYDKVDG